MNDALVPGSVQTLERLMARYGDGMQRMAYLLLHDRELARDAAQESFLKAYRALDTLREGESERAWLMRIAVNTCRDMRRSRWWRFVNRRVTPDDLPETASAGDAPPDPTVLAAVMNLPEKYRQIVVLHYYQEMTLVEIAQALGVPSATVRTRLMRAKDRLRGQLEGWYYDA